MNTLDASRDRVCPLPATKGILVAEDDPAERFLLRRAIEKAGFDLPVDFVPDGIDVLRYLQNPPRGSLPSLLLLDLKMPELDGFEVLEWLQHHPELRPPYVVVFSSSPSSSDITRASRLGVDHYLVKPSDPVELLGTVKRLEPYWVDLPLSFSSATETPATRQLATAV